jgi:hypothetical protein
VQGKATGVIDLALDWQQASEAAAGLAVVSLALRAAPRPLLTKIATAAFETGLILGLYALWQYAGSLSALGPDGAVSRARWIWHFERDLRLPSEAWLQRLVLPHPLVVQFFNLYYDVLHFPVLIACMIWLFVWHRADYGRWRTTLVVVTGLCLIVQLIPVAPPRMLASTGMVDTAIVYHQSVYANAAGFDPDQLSAMPSVHVGWAILVAIAVIGTLRSRWRWLAVAYPVMTTLAVVVTANHFWLDGIVAAAILAGVLAAQALLGRLWRLRSRRRLVLGGARRARPSWVALRLVADDDPQGLSQYRGRDRELSRTDDRALQRLLVDHHAERGAPQVGQLHTDLAQVDPGQLGSRKPALRQRRTSEVDVAQHAVVEGDVAEQ